MCLAIPARIRSVNGFEAEVELGEVVRSISLWLMPEAVAGDYVYVHAGFAVSIVDEADALENLRLLKQLAEDYPNDLFYTTSDLPYSDPKSE
jgi:hydrogenase expression/formation protein HypC